MDFDGLEDALSGGWRQFICDAEGPVLCNNNALEVCSAVIDNGRSLFETLSSYDRFAADMAQRPGWKTGDALKLVLPFLKAYGATDSSLLDFSRKHIDAVPGACKTMRFVQEFMTPFLLATSYEHYMTAACDAIGFPFESTYCTVLDMDKVRVDKREAERLRGMAIEIAAMGEINAPKGASSVRDLSPKDRLKVERLDTIFLDEMKGLSAHQFLTEVTPLGGEDKASAVLDIRRRTGIGLEDTMYVGDSLTDGQAFQLVRDGGGMTIAFNGDAHALGEAEVAVVSDSAVVMSVLAETFHKAGTEGVWSLVDDWSLEGIERSGAVNEYLVKEVRRTFPASLPIVRRVSPENAADLVERGASMRRGLKGESIVIPA